MRISSVALNVMKVLLVVAVGSLGGCVLAPREAKQERVLLDRAGEPYRQPFEHRELPDLPTQPEWSDVMRRAALANGNLVVAY
jgi:hypothetical protein